MKFRSWMVWLLVVIGPTVAFSQNNTRDGVALGGIAGAITGGIIGHQNDETPEGALIGGAVGAIAGGLIGNAKDRTIEQQRYYQYQAVQQQRMAVTYADIINMSRSGVSDNVIINQIRTNGIVRKLETHDIIALHQQGVSEVVIDAMQRAPIAGVTYVAPAPVPQPRRTTVIEYHVTRPRYVPAYPYHPHYHAHRPMRAYHW